MRSNTLRIETVSEFPDSTDQDEVFADYKEMLGEENAGKLHQFFSPTKIPRSLTKKQAMICVRLLPLRKEYTERKLKKKPGLTQILDPRSLESDDSLESSIKSFNREFSLNTLIGTMNLPRELISDGSPISKFRFYFGITKLIYKAVWKD